MKYIKYLFFITYLFLSNLSLAQVEEDTTYKEIELHWENCSAKDGAGNFTIKFPEEPLYDQTLQTLKLLHKGIKYELTFEHNKKHKDLHSAKHLLNTKTNEFIRKLNKFHKVEIDTSIELKMLGLNAQETWLKYSELGKTNFIILRILITHDHIYEFVLRNENEYVTKDIRDIFIDSFHLLDNRIIKVHWHSHISTRGHFKIDLPADVIIGTSKNYQIITSNVDEISCQLYYPREPKGYSMNDADAILDNSIENLQKELGEQIELVLEDTEELQMLGYPAKQARFSAKKSGIAIKIIFRVLITPRELFQFQIVSPYEYVDENTAHRFFDSFTILN